MVENGLNFTAILLFQAIYNIAKIFMALPVGAMGDIVGQKFLMITGTFSKSLFYVLLIIGINSTPLLVLAFIVIAYGDSAVEYSRLSSLSHYTKDSDAYKDIYGKIQAGSLLLVIIVNFGSGYLYEVNSTFPFVLTIVILLVSMLVSLGLKNAHISRPENKLSHMDTIRTGIREVSNNVSLKEVFLKGSIITVIFKLLNDLKQPYMTSVGFSSREMGTIASLLELGTIFAAYKAGSFEKLISKGKFKYGIILSVITGLVVFGVDSKLGSIMFFIAPTLLTVIKVGINGDIANHTTKEVTSTIFAYFGLITSVLTTAMLFLLGPAIDNLGIHNSGLLFSILLGFSLIVASKVESKKQTIGTVGVTKTP